MNTGEEYREIKTGDGATKLKVILPELNTRYWLIFVGHLNIILTCSVKILKAYVG